MTVTTFVNADGYHYVVPMAANAYSSLCWIAARYPSADVLVLGSTHRPNVLIVPERVAHDYLAELEEEDGSPIIPPCAGGPLANALVDLWQAIE